MFQFQLHSTWGDPFYIGLNGLELYDERGAKIPLTADNIGAYPESVNVLPDNGSDLRTPDKLVDGVCDTLEGHHMWLSPVLPHVTNTVFVVFNTPRVVSKVKLWNYGKTRGRGVKDLALLVDDLLVFTGTMPATPTHARGILPTVHAPLDPFLITFRDTIASTTQHSSTSLPAEIEPREGDVQFTNNRQVVSGDTQSRASKLPPAPNQNMRPLTSLTQTAAHPSNKWWLK